MKFRRLVPIFLFFAALAPGEIRKLTILHINDLHAKLMPLPSGQGGFARLAGAIRRERSGCKECILLDGGDVVQGSPVSTLFKGLPIFEALNRFGIDASTLGNHDFDYGWEMTRRFLKAAHYPIVSANIANGSGQLMSKPYVILKANGLRIAVIGATTEALPRLTTPNLLGEWHALPVIDTVRKAVAEVKGQSDIVVLIGHLTAPEELETLKSIIEIPVIVSGHVHSGLPAPTEVDGRVLVRVRSYAQELGRLDLDWDTDARRIKKWSWKRTPIDAKVPPAGDVAKIVAKWDKKVAKMVDVPIGTSRRNLTQKDLKPIMERAMVEEMKADFAFMNPGGIRDQIPQGTVLARHVWNVMPFDNKVVVGLIKGRDLPKAVRDGRSIDPGRDYRLAVTDFTAENQGEMGSKGLKFTEAGPVFRDLLVDWIKKQKVLN